MSSTDQPQENAIWKSKYTTVKCGSCGSVIEVVKGSWLRKVREQTGISLREMARRLNLSAGYISHVENGERNGTPDIWRQYEKLAD